jgi:hypothetical protein
MLSEFIPFKWLKEAWQVLGGGSVYIRAVKIDSINGFVRGYFTKQVLNQPFPYRARRYSCSRNITLHRPSSGQYSLHKWVSIPWISKDGQSKPGYYASVDRLDFARVDPVLVQEGGS